jgi:hypothetical protein
MKAAEPVYYIILQGIYYFNIYIYIYYMIGSGSNNN